MNPALLFAPLAVALSSTTPAKDLNAMPAPAPALSLDVVAEDGLLSVELAGLSTQALDVRYTIEVTGRSTSRHSGTARLEAGTRAVLSKLRTNTAGDWCVRLEAEETGRPPYTITRGTCAAD